MNARTHKPQNGSSALSFTPALATIAQRKCACGGVAGLNGECSSCQQEKLLGDKATLQPKLKVSQPNDKFEQEADRVADEVMRMPESKVQHQSDVKNKDSDGLIQTKPIASKITPFVQRETAEEEEEQLQLKAKPGNGVIQREESKDKPKSNEDKAKEALKKTGEAFLETEPGKKIKEKGKEVATTLPGVVIVGPAAVAAVAAIAALNKELPIQAPAIPLDKVHPGLSMNITIEGPVRTPSKVVIGFSGKFGAPKKNGRKKPAKTEAEKLREQNAAQRRKDFEFRESLKTPEEKARDQDFLNAFILQNMRDPTNPLFIPGLKGQNEVPFDPIQQEKPKKEIKEEGSVQRKESNNSEIRHSDSSLVQNAVKSSGHALDPATRNFMEQRFGHDFSQVKVHKDNKATASSKAINARAYTLGQDIVFGVGQYSPKTKTGKQLLAHELTHVVQQSEVDRVGRVSENRKQEKSITQPTLQRRNAVITRKKSKKSSKKKNAAKSKKQIKAQQLFWNDIHEFFPKEGRKLAGSGYDERLDYLRTSFQEGEESVEGVTKSRSAPIIYVGNKYFSEPDKDKRKAAISVELGKINTFRFNTARIDNGDLSNRVITGMISKLDVFGKRDYLQKLDEQEFIENEQVKEFIRKSMPSTQLEDGAIATAEGGFTLQFKNIKIVVKPDVFNSPAVPANEGHTEMKRIDTQTYKTKPGFNWGSDDKVVSMTFTPTVPQLIYKVETHYGPRTNPQSRSGYGVGTRPEDSIDNSSLRFHEGTHGTIFIKFIKDNINTNSFPVFDGSLGENKDDFGDKVDVYERKVIAFDQMLKDAVDASEQEVDCVGKTIEQFHTEKGTTSTLKCK